MHWIWPNAPQTVEKGWKCGRWIIIKSKDCQEKKRRASTTNVFYLFFWGKYIDFFFPDSYLGNIFPHWYFHKKKRIWIYLKWFWDKRQLCKLWEWRLRSQQGRLVFLFFLCWVFTRQKLKSKSKETGYSISGMRKLKINQIHPETQKGTKIVLNQKEKFNNNNKKKGGGMKFHQIWSWEKGKKMDTMK